MDKLEYAFFLRDKIRKAKFDALVRMSKSIIANMPKKPDPNFQYEKIPLNRSINYALDFYSKINKEYYYRVLNIIRENLKNDNYQQGDISWIFANPETFPIGKGLCFVVTDNTEKQKTGTAQISDEIGDSFYNSPTGEVVVDDIQSIETASHMVHELGHKLSLSNSTKEYGNDYVENPSITLETMFFDYLKSIGYNEEEINALEYSRFETINSVSSVFLVVNKIIERGERNPDIDEIINELKEEYPAFAIERSFNIAIQMMFSNNDYSQQNITSQIENTAKYITGLVMSSYFKKDYYENKDKAKLFRFMHLFPDNLISKEEKEQEYKELGLPFEADNIDEIINTFEEEYSSKKEQVSLTA